MNDFTPYHHGEPQTPMSEPNPLEYFDVWRIETTMPILVLEKVTDMVLQYEKMKPEMMKKHKEMRILFEYNEKLVRTLEECITREKKIVDRYNALLKIYIDSFKKYCSSKNWELNFNANPLQTTLDKININSWKFNLPEESNLPLPQPFEEKLMRIIEKRFLNEDSQLEKHLEAVAARGNWQHHSEEMTHIEQIRLDIRQLSSQKLTINNMFDLLEKRKSIERELRQLDLSWNSQEFVDEDLKFIDQLTVLYRSNVQIEPEKLKKYLDNQTYLRKKLKKKHKKMREQIEVFFEKIQSENTELKEELDIQKRKKEECEKERNHFKSLYEYMQLKGAASSRKEKTLNNAEIAEDSSLKISDIGMRETSRKIDIRVSELQTEIKQLKLDLATKEKVVQSLQHKQQDLNRKQKQIREKLLLVLKESQKVQIGAQVTIFELLDKVLEKKSSEESGSASKSQKNQSGRVNIVISQSLPFEDLTDKKRKKLIQSDDGEKNKQFFEHSSIIELQQSVQVIDQKLQEPKSEPPSSEKEEVVSPSSLTSSPTFANVTYNTSEKEKISKIGEAFVKRKNTSPALVSGDLLDISEKNPMEQESKQIQNSKHIRDSSLSSKQKFLQKNSHEFIEEHFLQVENVIKKLKQENISLSEEIGKLKGQMKIMESKLSEKEKLLPKSFLSSLEDIKNTDTTHVQQIETLCQSIAKELIKLQGNQFQRMLSDMEDAIKTRRMGEAPLKKPENMNEPPTLSKNLQEDNLFKSDNVLLNFVSKLAKEDDQKCKMKSSFTTEKERSMKLTLQSGEVKLHIKQQKSIYFGNKEMISQINRALQNQIPKSVTPQETAKELAPKENQSFFKFDQEQDIIEGVNAFNMDGLAIRNTKKAGNNSEQSLKLSNTHFKNSLQGKESQLKQSMKIGFQKYLDSSYLAKLQKKLQDVKNNNQNANDLYWFYKKYKQAMEALERTQNIIRVYEQEKQACMNKLTAEGAVSKLKLEQTIYFLQQRVSELESRYKTQKIQYQDVMCEQLTSMEDLKEKALRALGMNFLQLQA